MTPPPLSAGAAAVRLDRATGVPMHEISTDNPALRFYSLPKLARWPEPADRSGMGSLPTRAYRHCDAVTSAAGWGWYVFAPMAFELQFDGESVFWTHDGMPGWEQLGEFRFPGLEERFDAAAPAHMAGYEPGFLAAVGEPGVVQIWTGLLARTAPGWSVLLRQPSNLPRMGGYEMYEGIVETDRWFGPLFTNIRMIATNRPVRIGTDIPLLQVAPVPQWLYGDKLRATTPADITRIGEWTLEDWARYDRTMVIPNKDPERRVGNVAAENRRRRRAGCPVDHSSSAAASSASAAASSSL